ncbi:MAG: hypothetical protein ACRBBO_13615, partial [Cognatishimia sp.]
PRPGVGLRQPVCFMIFSSPPLLSGRQKKSVHRIGVSLTTICVECYLSVATQIEWLSYRKVEGFSFAVKSRHV